MAGSRAGAGRLGSLLDAVRSSLWPLPLLCLVVALGVGIGLPRLDGAVDDSLPPVVTELLFGGGPGAARSVLETVAGSLITVTSLTFSLTVVTLQLASSQFSPRLLRTFTRDRVVHVTLALFLSTFTYALTVLRTIRTDGDAQQPFVPQLSVTLAFVLTVVSVMALVLFLAHLARQIRVETMLKEVYDDARTTLSGTLSERAASGPATGGYRPPAGATVLLARTSGFFVDIRTDQLAAAAAAADAVVLVDRVVGDFLVAGTPIAVTWSPDPAGAPDVASIRHALDAAVRTGVERTAVSDTSYGLGQISDVAAKALSPGVNDPTTAVHALGYAAALLCHSASLDLGPHVLNDDRGQVRVLLRQPDFADLLEVVVGPARRYGRSDPTVLDRLFGVLRELAWCCTGQEQRRAVADQLARVRATVEDGDLDLTDRLALAASASQVDSALAGDWPVDDL